VAGESRKKKKKKKKEEKKKEGVGHAKEKNLSVNPKTLARG